MSYPIRLPACLKQMRRTALTIWLAASLILVFVASVYVRAQEQAVKTLIAIGVTDGNLREVG